MNDHKIETILKIGIGGSWLLFLAWVMFLYPQAAYTQLGYGVQESHPEILIQSIFINPFLYMGIGFIIAGFVYITRS